MVARVESVALTGFSGSLIEVETDIRVGLPGLMVVGMGNKAIDEARERVRSAVTNSLLDFPSRKLTVNLAPAELPKDGSQFDLPIALSILVAAGQLKQTEVNDAIFAGELALDGRVRPIRGAIIIAEAARTAGLKRVYLPLENLAQARLVTGIEVIAVKTLKDLFLHLKGLQELPEAVEAPQNRPTSRSTLPLLSDIRGHEQAKRALIIAAAGRHNLLLSGSPGAGKTLLARALSGLLPQLSNEETLEATKLHSLSFGESGEVITAPPFRSPHHGTSLTALVGGGSKPKPGEISLAHRGVLFLDELPEYSRQALEALRQPLEDGAITITRAHGRLTYPADVLLVATMNPCPCGFLGDPNTKCNCTAQQILAYSKRLSGPLLDRIDLRLTVTKVPFEQLLSAPKLSLYQQQSKVLELMHKARLQQHKRYNRSSIYNSNIPLSDAKKLFNIGLEANKFLITAAKKLDLTTRGYYRVLRVARTIADLAESESVEVPHVAEALQFRG